MPVSASQWPIPNGSTKQRNDRPTKRQKDPTAFEINFMNRKEGKKNKVMATMITVKIMITIMSRLCYR